MLAGSCSCSADGAATPSDALRPAERSTGRPQAAAADSVASSRLPFRCAGQAVRRRAPPCCAPPVSIIICRAGAALRRINRRAGRARAPPPPLSLLYKANQDPLARRRRGGAAPRAVWRWRVRSMCAAHKGDGKPTDAAASREDGQKGPARVRFRSPQTSPAHPLTTCRGPAAPD